jgi:Domain of unknown function (DUF4855)
VTNRRWLLGTGLLLAATAAVADYAPPGDLRDLMLIYCGEERWTPADFRPYVAYLAGLDGNQPKDWFYDSFLFMQYGGAPSGALYIDGKTNKADWESFRRTLFDPTSYLQSLDACIEQVSRILGRPPRPVPVVVMIPYPHPDQTDFGDVDGDGASENLREPADLAKVLRWHIGAVIDEFARVRFRHLKLYGFYWMIEWLSGAWSEAALREGAAATHERGLKYVWIPAYGAGDAERSRDMGFDVSYIQPNYAFMNQAGQEPDPQRLCEAAERARDGGLGMEIELDPQIVSDPRYRRNLLDYLAHGAEGRDGYMTQAPHAYYQSSHIIRDLQSSPKPANRRLYDALYLFARGRFAGDTDRSLVVDAQPDACLADGREKELLSGGVRAVTWRGRATVELDLGGLRPVGAVRAHYQLPKADAPRPRWMTASFSTEAEGDAWQDIPALAAPDLEPSPGDTRFRTGAVALRLARTEARRVRVEVWGDEGAEVTLDEVQAFAADPPGLDIQCAAKPPTAAAASLVDGLYDAPGRPGRVAQWGEPVELTLDLGVRAYVSGVALHLPGAMTAPRRVSVASALEGAEAADAGQWQPGGARVGEWLSVSFTAREAQRLVLKVNPGDKPFRCDEITVVSPPNLALRRPYRVEPGWTSKYPDDGKKLTDGERTAKDFGDGKAVGWSRADPTITVDLGQAFPVDEVHIGAEGGGYGWVYLPAQVTAFVSDDGSAFRPAGELRPQITESGDAVLLETLRVPMGGAQARYVRVSLRRHGWAMIDEVEVISGGRNVAAGRPYFVSPPPDPEDKYADTTGQVLTDGEWGGTAWGQGKTVGWAGVNPVVEIDLGRDVAAKTVRAYVVGGGPGGVWFPTRVSASVSRDAATDSWHPAGETTERPPETGNQLTGAFMTVPLDGTPFRYVRLQVEPRGWVMLGEVEVYE